MKPTAILALAIWVFVVGGNIVNTLIMSPHVFSDGPQLPWPIVFMPLVIVIGAFRMREAPGAMFIGKWADRRFGEGTYREFLTTLRPELMFSAMCFCIVAIALARGFLLQSPAMPPAIIGFFASGGVAFLIAYFIRRQRRSGPRKTAA
jgi:hypothetical protein